MKRATITLIITVLLLTFGVLEIFYVNDVIFDLKHQVSDITQKLETSESIGTTIYDDVAKLKQTWMKKENFLCHIIIHKDLSAVTDAITRMEVAITLDDYQGAYTNAKVLEVFIEKSKHTLGFNINNII